jgi:hypothetical protein
MNVGSNGNYSADLSGLASGKISYLLAENGSCRKHHFDRPAGTARRRTRATATFTATRSGGTAAFDVNFATSAATFRYLTTNS